MISRDRAPSGASVPPAVRGGQQETEMRNVFRDTVAVILGVRSGLSKYTKYSRYDVAREIADVPLTLRLFVTQFR